MRAMSHVNSLENVATANAGSHGLHPLDSRSIPSNRQYQHGNLKRLNLEARSISIDLPDIDIDIPDIDIDIPDIDIDVPDIDIDIPDIDIPDIDVPDIDVPGIGDDVKSGIENIVDTVGDEVAEIIDKAIEEIRTILKTIPAELEDYFQNITDEIQKRVESATEKIKEIVWTDADSIKNGLKPVMEFLDPVIEYVKEHPEVLIRLVIPVAILLIVGMGFTPAGIVAGSLAAVIHSSIGNAPKGSLFSYFQSVGARGWALNSLMRGNAYISIALLLYQVGTYLVDSGVVSNPEEIGPGIEGSWNRTLQIFEQEGDGSAEDTISGGGGVLKLDSRGSVGWVKYGLFAWLVVQAAVFSSEVLDT